MHIALIPETIATFGSFVLTNTLLTSWVVMAILVFLAWFFGKNLKLIPGKRQNFIEYVIEIIFNFFAEVWGDKKKAEKFFAFLATFFIFILLSNWFGLVPGVGSLGFYETHGEEKEFIPLLRSVNSDLNATLAWALISVLVIQFSGIFALGFFKYAGKFINFKSPVDFFVGVLELISEISKLISFSFRLFGNVFAGEVLLVVMMFLVPYILPLPFFMLEMFVGVVQALVFTTLTLVFLKLAMEKH